MFNESETSENMQNNDNESTSIGQAINVNVNASIAQAIILSAYETCETLDEDGQDQLIRTISETFLNAEIILKACEIKNIAVEICTKFPEEDMETYFVDGTKDVAPSGRLYNYFFNKVKYMRNRNLLPKSKRTVNKIAKIKLALEAEETYILNEGEVNSIKFLLQRGIKFSDAVLHWKSTFDYRQNVIQFSSPDWQIMFDEEWKVLQCAMGHILICEDFKALHGFERGCKLRLNWNALFTANKLLLLKGMVKEKVTVRLLNDLPTTNENLNIATILCLNAILIPPLQTGIRKPTIKDAQDSIVLMATDCSEVNAKIADRFGHSWKPHPIIFKIERDDNPIRFLVVFYNLRYNFIRFSEAIDVCFKMFIVFHIPFPKQSYQFFVLVNELFYKLNLNLRKSAKVVALLKNLQRDE